MRPKRLLATLVAAAALVALTACAPSVGTLTPVAGSGGGTTGGSGSTSAPQPQVTGGTGSGGTSSGGSADPSKLAPGGKLLNQVNYKDLTIYIYKVGELTTTKPSIFAHPNGDDPYPAGTEVEVTAYVLTNDSSQRLDLTDLSADYSSYGNKLAAQDTFAGQDLLTRKGYSTDLSTQFPKASPTWYLLPGKAVVFANAWFHRDSDGPLTLQFLWPSERIFLGANITF
ncbi:hypothetical protein GCM10025867_31490 [Frondihabitans sucicola]|uniref:DUF4352 domain-containing protein n=1 Tax=Frondihabitans sucicola TaxID=1268041 RepID=A0ABM8GR13_9MICO|nr:hypothetical protein [Frondihabitans sucicola]BDZ50908.1 hypothetical protein GCM10025867_31490 [Frondihabitans sucicola]